jgi:hypothetical protein
MESQETMIYIFVAPTQLGLLLTEDGSIPRINLPDDLPVMDLLEAIYEIHGAELQSIRQIGRINGNRVFSVAEYAAIGSLRSKAPPNNVAALLAAMARGDLTNWRITMEGENDFSIKFLGS